MKDYVRADLSKQPLDVRLSLQEQVQLSARAIAEAARIMMPRVLAAEKTVEGVTVRITIDEQAQQQPALLNQRINAAISQAMKAMKQKAHVRRGARKKETLSTENEAWFWKTFASAVKKARAKLGEGASLMTEQVAAEWLGKDGGCTKSNVDKLCRKYSFDPDGDHFGKALTRTMAER